VGGDVLTLPHTNATYKKRTVQRMADFQAKGFNRFLAVLPTTVLDVSSPLAGVLVIKMTPWMREDRPFIEMTYASREYLVNRLKACTNRDSYTRKSEYHQAACIGLTFAEMTQHKIPPRPVHECTTLCNTNACPSYDGTRFRWLQMPATEVELAAADRMSQAASRATRKTSECSPEERKVERLEEMALKKKVDAFVRAIANFVVDQEFEAAVLGPHDLRRCSHCQYEEEKESGGEVNLRYHHLMWTHNFEAAPLE